MTDPRIEKGCPFCGAQAKHIHVNEFGKGIGLMVELKCPRCGCTFRGSSREALIEKWNARV